MPNNGYTEWGIQLYNQRTNRPIDDDTGLFCVLTAGVPVRATVYSNDQGTSLTLPAAMSNGYLKFFTASSVTSVDISILSANGQSYFMEGVTPSQHRRDVDPEKQDYTFICDWNGNTACDAVADTGFDLLAGMQVNDVYIHVTTNTTATAMNFGVSGSTAGFLVLAVTSTTGYKFGDPVVTSGDTSLSYANYVKVTQVRGLLQMLYGAGLATATTGGEKGWFYIKPYTVTAATSLVYVVKETQTSGTGSGYIYVSYKLMQTQGN